MKICVSVVLMLFSISAFSQSLDKHHLLLDSRLEASSKSRYAFRTLQEAVAHFTDETTLYVAPGVYWVDHPDTPKVVVGADGREPFGMVVKAKKLHFIGLDKDPRNTVFASQRGQMEGAVGNFTMFDFWCDELTVENMTLGNFCNVDLDYPLDSALSRKKRSESITQAHIGYVHGQSLRAKNVRFISRLNLNPLNGADYSYYENCHFECTDDALNGTAVYRHCEVDLYGQKPFWSTFGKGALFIDCDFNVKSDNREMYFCKQGGPVTLINCRYHAPSDSLYIGWTPYPQKWLRCYHQDFTLNGKPYVIGHQQIENTIILSDFNAKKQTVPPYVWISRHEAEMQVGGKDTLHLQAFADGQKIQWVIRPPYHLVAAVSAAQGDSVVVSLVCDLIDDVCEIPVMAFAGQACAVCMVKVYPAQLPPPVLRKAPSISGFTTLKLDYDLQLDSLRDESSITWYRDDIPVSVSHGMPQRTYRLTAADKGHVITAEIRPKSNRSDYGEAKRAKHVSNLNFSPMSVVETDFHDFPCQWQKELLPGYWTVDGYKPADTAEFQWSFDPNKPMWEYGEGFNGAVGKGLLQAQRGARLMYMPLEGTYHDMTLTLEVDPTKTAGQGFGSATGQYMDVCLKFDPITLTGYGLRIIRTTKSARAVDFYLIEYKDGQIKPLTDPISSTCYRTGCTIQLQVEGKRLTAHVETKTPQPEGSQLPHVVDLAADIMPNSYGGIAIQHTGSCGESTTMLHHLVATYDR